MSTVTTMFICEVGPLQNQRILFHYGLDYMQAPLLSLSRGMSSWGVGEVLSKETSEGSISTTSAYNHLEYASFPCTQLLLASISPNSTNSHLIIIWVPMVLEFTAKSNISSDVHPPRNSENSQWKLITVPPYVTSGNEPLQRTTLLSPITFHQNITESHRWPLLCLDDIAWDRSGTYSTRWIRPGSKSLNF